ncbi:hypothetical protein GGS21DRAFT_482129 [Xylaria nigripes]|nr:hypothetical protein GGS21DRAFT_482129 [Xylaria nigripes]
MKSPQQILTLALALSPLAAAWSGALPEADSLVVRQKDQASSQDNTPTQTASPQSTVTDESPSATATDKPTATGSDDGNSKPTGTGKGSTKTTNSPPKHTTFNALDPPGGVAMISPATTAAMPLYRIDNVDPIIWKWNYTSLQGTPTAIDVLISCSFASETWTLTQNMTFAPTATFTWDSNKFQQTQIASPLVVQKYTLLIHDSAGSITDTPEPGYLAPFSGLQFGLYTAKPYENLNEWECVTCSAAPGGLERQALGFAITMTLLTVLSFTWYVTGIAALV